MAPALPAGCTPNEVLFERRLAETGVQLINSRPYHPETLGKLERLHRTLKEWLAEEGPAEDLVSLQALLDRFRVYYNEERPHQGIGDLTPAERYELGFELVHGEPPVRLDAPDNETTGVRYPDHSMLRRVSARGEISFEAMCIQLGRRWKGATVRVVTLGELIHVYHDDTLIRALVPDRSRRHQSLGKRPSRRRALALTR